MNIIAVDIMPSLPVTEDGLRYILVLITEDFAKWAYAFALPDAKAFTCMHIMYDDFFSPSLDYPTSSMQIKAGILSPNYSMRCAS